MFSSFMTRAAWASGLLLSVGIANAQTNPPARQPATPPSQAEGPASQSDSLLATWVVIASENEIALAQFAQQRSQNNEVKQFAQKMVDEHRQIVQKLQPFTSGTAKPMDAGAERHGETGREDTGRSDPTRPQDPSKQDPSKQDPTKQDPTRQDPTRQDPTRQDPSKQDPTKQDPTRPHDPMTPREASGVRTACNHVTLIRDLGRKCLESSRRELESKQGEEFDRCYVGMQIMAHMQAADMIDVFKNHASDRLRTALNDGQRTVQAHLDHAKTLGKKLEGKTTGTGGTNGK